MVVKHLRYNRFNQVVAVNRICSVRSCLEIGVGNSHEIAFSVTIQKVFQTSVSQVLIKTQFILRGTKCLKPVIPYMSEIQILTFSTRHRCNSLWNHGLFRYSMFSAPGDIIGNFTNLERWPKTLLMHTVLKENL